MWPYTCLTVILNVWSQCSAAQTQRWISPALAQIARPNEVSLWCCHPQCLLSLCCGKSARGGGWNSPTKGPPPRTHPGGYKQMMQHSQRQLLLSGARECNCVTRWGLDDSWSRRCGGLRVGCGWVGGGGVEKGLGLPETGVLHRRHVTGTHNPIMCRGSIKNFYEHPL